MEGAMEGRERKRTYHSVDLVNKILHTNQSVFSELLLDEGVVSQGEALLVDLDRGGFGGGGRRKRER